MTRKMSALTLVFIMSLCITGFEQFGFIRPFGHSPWASLPPPHNPRLHGSKNPDKGTKNPSPTILNPGLDATGMPKDGKNHPCYRLCKAGETMTCYYKFHVEWYHSMSKACLDCPRNATHCASPDCVPANGVPRPITVVNRKMPGPAIEVCKGDTLVVDVQNSLMSGGTTIHWHGLHQKETPYMDGTPFVTQCPILPESTFRYRFGTPTAGTYFWHAHIGLQRSDGVTGPLVIREPRQSTTHARLYDVDQSEHVMLITDWLNNITMNLFTDHHHSDGDNRPEVLLVNGRGRFTVNQGGNSSLMKAPVFDVEQGKRYRFRFINAEFLNCPVELSVDGHNITVIAADGYDVAPLKVSRLVSYAGERFDFVINADKPVNSYWIRIRGLLACANVDRLIRQVAVLRYRGADDEPAGPMTWPNQTGLVLNQVQEGEEQNVSVPISRLQSISRDKVLSKQVPDHQFYISFDVLLKNNTHFQRPPFYGTDKISELKWLFTPQLNHISMKLPSSPLLVSKPSSAGFCNESTIQPSCKTEYCECPHVLNVKLNTVVELVLIDEGNADTNHPLHLHGHSFRVLTMRKVGNITNAQEVKALDAAGRIVRNLKTAPVKDTVTTPEGGYTIVRFFADNPGYWFFHCHLEFHADIGMGLVFKVGEHNQMKPVPKNFPKCGDYMPRK